MLCVQCLAPENDHCGCVGEDGDDSEVFDAAEEILALRAENDELRSELIAVRAKTSATK